MATALRPVRRQLHCLARRYMGRGIAFHRLDRETPACSGTACGDHVSCFLLRAFFRVAAVAADLHGDVCRGAPGYPPDGYSRERWERGRDVSRYHAYGTLGAASQRVCYRYILRIAFIYPYRPTAGGLDSGGLSGRGRHGVGGGDTAQRSNACVGSACKRYNAPSFALYTALSTCALRHGDRA